MPERYQGLRPHCEAASGETGADANRVIRDSTLARLDHLLCASDEHHQRGRSDAARATLEGARCHLAELDAVARAGRLAYAEAEGIVNAPKPPLADTPTPPSPEDHHHEQDGPESRDQRNDRPERGRRR